jgi:hypothetical protein
MGGRNRLYVPAAPFFVLFVLQAGGPQIGLDMGRKKQEDSPLHKTERSFYGRPTNTEP